MGSFGAGLASVGGSIAQARELQRQQKLEDIKLELEKARLGTEQGRQAIEERYAGIAGEREKLEAAKFAEQQRLSKVPKFIGFRSVGGKLYYGLQSPDGTVTTQEVTGVNAAEDAAALEQSIEGLPPEAQDAARSMIIPALRNDDYVSARKLVSDVAKKYTESKLPGQATVSDTTQTNVVDTPQGPAIISTPKRTVTRKVPAGNAPKMPTGPAPSPQSLTQMLGLPQGSKVIGLKSPSRAEIAKVITPVGDADRRLKIMQDAVAHPNPQNDIALTFNHIGMTLSAQRGARITEAEIRAAIYARSLPQDLQALWNRVSTGQFLTPSERQNMLGLAVVNRQLIWQEAWEAAKAEKMAGRMPRTLPGLDPVAGIPFVGKEVTLKTGGKARVASINPDGTYEVKKY